MAKAEILLMGDGSHPFRTIAWVLKYKDYSVKTTASPEAALDELVGKNYDMIIARLAPQDQDGLDVIMRARRLNPEIRVMVLSENHDRTLPLEAYELDADDYLMMPLSPAELWRRVSRCLEGREILDLKPVRVRTQPRSEISEQTVNQLMVMFHDLRGSLVSLDAALKLLLRGTYGALEEGTAAKIQEASGRVGQIVKQAEEGMISALVPKNAGGDRREILDLKRDIVDPVLIELAGEIKGRRVILENRLDQSVEGDIPVKGSKVWLMSVFRNLVNNAITYGEPGCSVVIDWERQGTNCRLNVYNSGKPISDKNQALLFSNRPLKSRKESQKRTGMGMGLYLSRDIINSFGGDMWYESKQDGSKFVVSLPQQ